MAKKIKPSSLLDEMTERSKPAVESTEIIDEKNPLIGDNRMTNADKEKLERYDALEKSVEGLLKEKENLNAKVTEYVERLAELQTAADQISDLNNQIEVLKKELADAQANVEPSFKLKNENKDLRNEVDNYLVKISELTFENANLRCQLDELAKKVSKTGSTPNSPSFAPNTGRISSGQGKLAQPHRDAYNPYYNNGYASW